MPRSKPGVVRDDRSALEATNHRKMANKPPQPLEEQRGSERCRAAPAIRTRGHCMDGQYPDVPSGRFADPCVLGSGHQAHEVLALHMNQGPVIPGLQVDVRSLAEAVVKDRF